MSVRALECVVYRNIVIIIIIMMQITDWIHCISLSIIDPLDCRRLGQINSPMEKK